MRLVRAPHAERTFAKKSLGSPRRAMASASERRSANRTGRRARCTSCRSQRALRRHASTIRCGEASHRLDFRQHERSLLSSRDEPCSRKRERPLGTLDFRTERVDARTICRGSGPGKRRSGWCSVARRRRNLERDELAPRCQHGRRRAEVKIVEGVACFGDPAKQEQPADLQERGVSRLS